MLGIIDAHVHIGEDWMGRKVIDVKRLASELRRRGIVKAVAMTLKGLISYCNIREDNNRLKMLTEKEPDMYIPFCTVSPYQGDEALAELRRAIIDLGMKGLKLHPWLQAFSITHPYLNKIIEEAARLGIPVVFHDGTPPYSTPLQICNLADTYPDVNIILAHSGLKDLWKNAIHCAEKHDNIYLCTCGVPYKGLQTIVERIGAERVIFGTDSGFTDPSLIDFRLEQILKLNIEESEREMILSSNIARLLKIS